MAQEELSRQLEAAISAARLSIYPPAASGETYGAYAWNIAVCESLYPALHCVEVTLRNSIHNAATAEFGDEYWFRTRLAPIEQLLLNNVEKELLSQGRELLAGEFISGFRFGFWVRLFERRYEQVLWPQLLQSVFPHIPRQQRRRISIRNRLIEVQTLRNRVFHHEPVWHWPDLPEQHSQILETVGWVSPAMRRFLEAIDRFPQVHSAGAPGYRRRLAAALPGVA